MGVGKARVDQTGVGQMVPIEKCNSFDCMATRV